MSNPIVSICLPLFEAGERLRGCLESIRQQTFSNFEVVIVADAPKDGSLEFAQSLVASDSRFRILVNEANQHIGKSRNIAMSHAVGEYITFVDHDDILAANLVERLLETAEKGVYDVVLSMPTTELRNDDVNNPIDAMWYEPTDDLVMRDLLTNGTIHQRNNSMFNTVWGCLYRRQFIEEHHLAFVDTRIITPEDRIFQIECLLSKPSLKVLPEYLYIHTERDTNAGRQQWYLNIDRRLEGLQYLSAKMRDKSVDALYYNYFLQGAAFQFIRLLAAAQREGRSTFVDVRQRLTACDLCRESMKFAPSSNGNILKRLYRQYLVRHLS